MQQHQHPADHMFAVSSVTHVVFTALDKTINWITLVRFILTRGNLWSISLVGSTFVFIRTGFEEDVICFGVVCEWNMSIYTHVVSKFTIFRDRLIEAVLPWGVRKALVTLFWSETWKSNKQIRRSETKNSWSRWTRTEYVLKILWYWIAFSLKKWLIFFQSSNFYYPYFNVNNC